jgi:hypothetical protein
MGMSLCKNLILPVMLVCISGLLATSCARHERQEPPRQAGASATSPSPAESPAAPSEEVSEGEPAENLPSRITKLIAQLGAPNFAEREAAQIALEKIGEPALTQIWEAVKSEDAEIATRATQLAGKMMFAEPTLRITDKTGKPLSNRKISITTLTTLPGYLNSIYHGTFGPSPERIEGLLSKDGTIAFGIRQPDQDRWQGKPIPIGKRAVGVYTLCFVVEGMAPQFAHLYIHPGERTYRLVAYEGGTIKKLSQNL